MTQILTVVDWPKIPSSLRSVGYAVCQGLSHYEISAQTGMSLAKVSAAVKELEAALVAQATARAGELSPALQERLEAMQPTNGTAPPDGG